MTSRSYDLPKETTIDSLELDIPKECLYFFYNAYELENIIKKVNNKDTLKEKRDYFTEYLLGKKATMLNIFLRKLENISKKKVYNERV